MTEQEALEILNRDDDEMRKGYFCINDFIAIEKAIEALEKQIPKKPKLFVGASRYKICPACHLVLSGVQRELELPCKCGQKLLWE